MNILVGHDGPAMIGLNLWLLGFRIPMYLDFCVSTVFFFFEHFFFQVFSSILKSCVSRVLSEMKSEKW